MNFFADESVDHPIVVRLREDGHNVLAVAEITPSIPDEKESSREAVGILLTFLQALRHPIIAAVMEIGVQRPICI